MSELLSYCLEQLTARPRALNISMPLHSSARISFTRFWSKARFEVQQQSILTLYPDDPLYGRGYLWYYELVWRTAPEGSLLRIQYNIETQASSRELILLASVSEHPIPFPERRTAFVAAKRRMLGLESTRMSGAVAVALRSGVANVQYSCQGGKATIAAARFPDIVDIEL